MNSFERHRVSLHNRIQGVASDSFDEVALEVYRFQQKYNPLFNEWIESIGASKHPSRLEDCAFMPIGLWKTKAIKTGNWEPEVIFESSGTGGATSRSYVRDLEAYLSHSSEAFWRYFGTRKPLHMYALLPSYHLQSQSSLIHMVNRIAETTTFGGYVISDLKGLRSRVIEDLGLGKQVLVFGVSFALLDLAQEGDISGQWDVIYTGGMKGRKEEMIEPELRQRLRQSWPEARLWSEYGMTELSSQSYRLPESKVYFPDERMRMLVAEREDPLSIARVGKGTAKIVDLGNLDTCSFVHTDDVISIDISGSFTILGRLDHSDVRGCNQLYTLSG